MQPRSRYYYIIPTWIVKRNTHEKRCKTLNFQGYLGEKPGSLFCFFTREYEKKPTRSGLAFCCLSCYQQLVTIQDPRASNLYQRNGAKLKSKKQNNTGIDFLKKNCFGVGEAYPKRWPSFAKKITRSERFLKWNLAGCGGALLILPTIISAKVRNVKGFAYTLSEQITHSQRR